MSEESINYLLLNAPLLQQPKQNSKEIVLLKKIPFSAEIFSGLRLFQGLFNHFFPLQRQICFQHKEIAEQAFVVEDKIMKGVQESIHYVFFKQVNINLQEAGIVG